MRLQYRLLWARFFEKQYPNPGKHPKKIVKGQMLGNRRLEKNSAKCFRWKRRDSESSIDIDRQNKRLRHESRTERARQGLRLYPRVNCFHTMVGDVWRAPLARHLLVSFLFPWCSYCSSGVRIVCLRFCFYLCSTPLV